MTGDELKKFRTQMALTQTQLANAIDRTRDMVAKYESGKYTIPQKIKERIWAMARVG
jgi:transcriptional regulator with XRE-family HTH domain